jgi:hypothetical protein
MEGDDHGGAAAIHVRPHPLHTASALSISKLMGGGGAIDPGVCPQTVLVTLAQCTKGRLRWSACGIRKHHKLVESLQICFIVEQLQKRARQVASWAGR